MNFLPGHIENDRLHLPFGTTGIPDKLRAALQSNGGGKREVIAGLRPEHFEDAAIEPEGPGRMKFKARVDVVESMGSELYVYFDVDAPQEVESDDLVDLAKDAGMEDLPGGAAGAGQHVVARLDAASKASPGGEVELTLDCTQIKLFDPQGGRSLLHPGTGAATGGARAAGATA